jgi:hypothetical protein
LPPIPEPSSIVLAVFAFAGLVAWAGSCGSPVGQYGHHRPCGVGSGQL